MYGLGIVWVLRIRKGVAPSPLGPQVTSDGTLVPAPWKDRRIFVTFDGVDSAFFLWVNGQKVGYSVNSRNAAEFDLTPYVIPGKNMMAVEVYRYSAGSCLEDQDRWRLSGIFRNVTLWSAPQVHVRDFFLKTDLDSQYRDATLEAVLKVKNYGGQAASACTAALDLFDRQGKPVSGSAAEAKVPGLGAGEETTVMLSLKVAHPAKWTAETPKLYTAVLTLKTGNQATEILSSRTGFRKVEIKGPVFMINGCRSSSRAPIATRIGPIPATMSVKSG